MKKLFILLIMTMFLLTGCRKCIGAETQTVQVRITNSQYVPGYNTIIHTGKTMTLLYHPAQYYIDVEYEGIEYTLFDFETYQKYFDKINSSTNATLEIKKYDDGTQKYIITELE